MPLNRPIKARPSFDTLIFRRICTHIALAEIIQPQTIQVKVCS